MKYQVNNILQSQQPGSGLVSPQGSWSHPYFTQSQSQHEDGESEQRDCLTLFDSSRSSFVATTWERTFLLYNVSFTSSSRMKMNRNTLTSTSKPYWAEDGCSQTAAHRCWRYDMMIFILYPTLAVYPAASRLYNNHITLWWCITTLYLYTSQKVDCGGSVKNKVQKHWKNSVESCAPACKTL